MTASDIPPPRHYLVIDFEANCCDRGSVPVPEMEIIEIGAVMVEAAAFRVIDEFVSFVRPVRHPTLTAFCTALTSITQSDIDAALGFVDIAARLKVWFAPYDDFVFCSWGDYDRKQLDQDCAFHQIPNPIVQPHINAKREFARRQGLRKRPGLGGAIAEAGLAFEGTQHRGIDDARNIARLLPYAFGNMRISGKAGTAV